MFDHCFDLDTELTGYMKLRLWVEAEGPDMDLFVAIQKLDRDGNVVGFMFYAFYDNGPGALDHTRSIEWQPVHSHIAEEPLAVGEIVPVEIELWPSSTLFRAGESLRVVVKGMDIYRDALPNLPFARHEELRNSGTHVIHGGGPHDSHLFIPDVPEKQIA